MNHTLKLGRVSDFQGFRLLHFSYKIRVLAGEEGVGVSHTPLSAYEDQHYC